MSTDRLIVFLRAPRLGTVKTRLATRLGPAAALAAYRKLVEWTLPEARGGWEVTLCFTPDDAGAEVEGWRRPGWQSRAQGEGDLGRRLHGAIAAALADGARRVVVIGTDCPELKARDIEAAFNALETSDLVLGPASDGGYWLIGLRQPVPELFTEMPWSTARVFAETMRRAELLGLTVWHLRELSDVDTAESWERVERHGGA